ncbi:MAG: methylated-DNA--[protein]-cysteine S-methyltransferase [Anaerolineae bacterium]|nr:methylated-DNA--[protein]-cysteine S-methyltransferase [Anaerolineae bacterium]
MVIFDEQIAIGWTTWEPVGRVYAAAGPNGVIAVTMGPIDESEAATQVWGMFHIPTLIDERATSDAIRQLDEYFRGQRRTFDLPLDLRTDTPFQRLVLQYVQHRIPPGQTATYGQIAAALGDPERAIAVGQALAVNPLPILIPCHRVIGSDGSLVGYSAFGGVETKAALLRHEGALLL